MKFLGLHKIGIRVWTPLS